MSKNPLTMNMGTNKFNGMIYNDWLWNLGIILDFVNQSYVLDKPLPTALLEGSSPEECVMFKKWLKDNLKIRSIILASMTNDIQKQYDRLKDVPSIMLHMKEATNHKSATAVLVGEVSNSKAKCKMVERWKSKKGKEKAVATTTSAPSAPTSPMGMDKGKGKVGGSQ
ncbi:UNVERIFIED_CONTAM: hypothetical protein Slati_2978200 [Sesamum latifolium]|uniref:Uncharacterized protein n=1 Tax=Sesamum latifolium TaxID=2727402 RepID=A0AAW2VE39_9LAMI